MTCRFSNCGQQHFQPEEKPMSKTKLILTDNVVGLGSESDMVEVASGYARNFLLPQGRAIPASAGNERYLDSLKKKRAQREFQEQQNMQALKESLDKLPPLVITVKTGEGGKMFGSVTVGMICDEMKNQFDVELDKRKVALEKSIRDLGDHEVELKLHADITGTLKVKVESENPLPEPEEIAAEEAKKQEPAAEEAKAEGA